MAFRFLHVDAIAEIAQRFVSDTNVDESRKLIFAQSAKLELTFLLRHLCPVSVFAKLSVARNMDTRMTDRHLQAKSNIGKMIEAQTRARRTGV